MVAHGNDVPKTWRCSRCGSDLDSPWDLNPQHHTEDCELLPDPYEPYEGEDVVEFMERLGKRRSV